MYSPFIIPGEQLIHPLIHEHHIFFIHSSLCFGHAKFIQVLAREPHKKESLDFSPAIELMGDSGTVSDRVPYTVQDNSRRAYLKKE